MKKKLLLLLASLFMAAAFSACSDEGNTFQSKTYAPDGAEIRGIELSVKDREIEVVLSDDEQLRLDYAENEKEFYNLSVSEDGVLSMESASDKGLLDYFGVKKSAGHDKITIRIPRTLSLSTLTLKTTKEKISLPALAVTEELTLSTNGGNISFEEISDADSITLENKNGDIDGTIGGSWDDYAITCKIKKGESNLPEEKDGGDKSLTVVNNNGDIDIEFTGG